MMLGGMIVQGVRAPTTWVAAPEGVEDRWPGPKHLGVERAKGGDAWKIRCTNPEKSGAYAVVDVWVSQSSGALMKLHGYNAAGKLVKTFEVKRVQRHEGAWILEKMFVRTHGRRVTSTTLEVESPR